LPGHVITACDLSGEAFSQLPSQPAWAKLLSAYQEDGGSKQTSSRAYFREMRFLCDLVQHRNFPSLAVSPEV